MKYLLMTLLLSVFATGVYSQVENENKGIFDTSPSFTVTSNASLAKADGFGKSSYRIEKLPNNDLKVHYTYNKLSTPNPLFIAYSYGIKALPSGDFAMDMEGAMPPLSLYIDTNAMELSYVGDKIFLPNNPTSDTLLSDVKGIFYLKKRSTNGAFLVYEVAIINRKFVKMGNLILNGNTYESFRHSYDFVQNTFLDGNILICKWEDTVEEIYFIGYGMVNQVRRGHTMLNIEGEEVIDEELISELLDIK